MYTTVYKCSKFIVHLPRPMFPTSIDFNLIDIQCLSTVGVSSEYEVTITLFGFAAFKASTHHPKFNISGIFILQSWSKISSRICPANNLSLQMSHGREKTQTVTARLLQMPSGERAPLNKKTELIQKDPLPPAVEWKRETSATQTLPWAAFLSRLGGRGMQERGSLFCTGRPAEEKQEKRLRRGCPTCPAQGVLGTHASPGDWPTPASQALLSSDFTIPGQKKREH